MLLTEMNADLHTLLTCSDNIRCGTGHKMHWVFYVLYVSSATKWTNCAIVPMKPWRPLHSLRSLEEMMRVASGNFQECLDRNIRKAYFDRRTS